MNTLKIKPAPNGYFTSYKMHSLTNLTVDHINSVLGFVGYQRNHPQDGAKVVNEWRFMADGQPCAIWDYKGSHHLGAFSAWGPRGVFDLLFTGRVES